MANAESMIQVYREDKDIHLYTACRAFGRDYDYYAGLSDRKDMEYVIRDRESPMETILSL